MSLHTDLLTQIQAATGFVALKAENSWVRTETIKEYQYRYWYRVGGFVRMDMFNVIVFSEGTADESAEFMGGLPAILDQGTTSAWKMALLAKKASLLAGDATIKRINLSGINEVELYGFATVYKLVTGKINRVNYFLWDVAGTPNFAEYTGQMGF